MTLSLGKMTTLSSHGSQFCPGLRLIDCMILGKVVQPPWISISSFTDHFYDLNVSLKSSWVGNLSLKFTNQNILKLSLEDG